MPETARATGDKLFYIAPSGALIEEIGWLDPEAVFLPHGAHEGALWLDSSAPQHELAQYSFIALAPYQMLRFAAHEAAQGLAALQEKLAEEGDLWHGLPRDIDLQVPPFRGGAAGLFGYDLGIGLEAAFQADKVAQLPQAQSDALVIGLYASVLAFDHKARRCFIIATGLPHKIPAARADAARQDILRWQKLLTGVPSAVLPPPPEAPDLARPPRSNFSKHAYCDAVSALVGHILDGDIFQANLAQYFSAYLAEGDNALAYYRRLRRAGPAPFSAFFQMGERALASASPERFLQMADGWVETRPIKGTQKRGRDAQEDLAIAADLAASEKDRAENVMIVDLLRNDLAKNCRLGSIEVPQLCALESFANVHHLVSTVRGAVPSHISPVKLLADCFPGGSITGAPKIRAMQLIGAYEKTARGASYGSIGYIGFDGRMDTSIIIRTAEISGQRIDFHVGGGIVADSQPQAEYVETLNKARGLMAALGVDVDAWARAPGDDKSALMQ